MCFVHRVEVAPLCKAKGKKGWLRLCELAANEQDPDKLLALVKEISRLLDEKERRVNARKFPAAKLQRSGGGTGSVGNNVVSGFDISGPKRSSSPGLFIYTPAVRRKIARPESFLTLWRGLVSQHCEHSCVYQEEHHCSSCKDQQYFAEFIWFHQLVSSHWEPPGQTSGHYQVRSSASMLRSGDCLSLDEQMTKQIRIECMVSTASICVFAEVTRKADPDIQRVFLRMSERKACRTDITAESNARSNFKASYRVDVACRQRLTNSTSCSHGDRPAPF
jgi:hypothetical protein